MILADFECPKCGIREDLCNSDEWSGLCKCGEVTKRIISVSGQYCGNQDATWIKSVLEVVDKESKAKHVQDFIKHPNRSNYKAWMKGEGIRPADFTEHGGPPTYRKPERNTDHITKELWRRHRERKSLFVSLS